MLYRLAADATLFAHLAFIAFVVAGAALAWRWRWLALLHLPAALWGAYAELAAAACPLTALENRLRLAAGQAGYPGGFIEHYLVALIYPAGLTPALQWALGVGVLALNAVLYGLLLRRWRRAPTATAAR